MIVSVFPLEIVSVNTDFTRYVPLVSPLLVLTSEIELPLLVFVQLAPSTSFHTHKPQNFCNVWSTEILTMSVASHNYQSTSLTFLFYCFFACSTPFESNAFVGLSSMIKEGFPLLQLLFRAFVSFQVNIYYIFYCLHHQALKCRRTASCAAFTRLCF